MMSVPRLKISTTEDSAETVFDRITSTSGVPRSASSIGTVISCSTSGVDIPMPSVWISTRGGANSGNTSTGMLWTWLNPSTIRAVAAAITRKRNFRLDPMTQRNMVSRAPNWFSGSVAEFQLDAHQFGRTRGHDLRADGRAFLQDSLIAVDVLDFDAMPDKGQRFGSRVSPRASFIVIDDRRVRNDRLRRPASGLGNPDVYLLPRLQVVPLVVVHYVVLRRIGAAAVCGQLRECGPEPADLVTGADRHDEDSRPLFGRCAGPRVGWFGLNRKRSYDRSSARRRLAVVVIVVIVVIVVVVTTHSHDGNRLANQAGGIKL